MRINKMKLNYFIENLEVVEQLDLYRDYYLEYEHEENKVSLYLFACYGNYHDHELIKSWDINKDLYKNISSFLKGF